MKFLLILLFILSFSFPVLAKTANPCGYDEKDFHIVPPPSRCIAQDATGKCVTCEHTLCDAFVMIENVLNFLMRILAPLTLLAIISGGALYLLGGIKPDWLSLAKKILLSALIGMIIVLASWLIVNTLVNNVLHWNRGDSWFKLECTEEGIIVP